MNILSVFGGKKCQICQKPGCTTCKKDVEQIVSMGFSVDAATTAYLSHSSVERAVNYLASLPPQDDKPKSRPSSRNQMKPEDRTASSGSASSISPPQPKPGKENDVNSEVLTFAPQSAPMDVDQDNGSGSTVVSRPQNGAAGRDRHKVFPNRQDFKLDFAKGLICDVRDSVGKWVPGEVVQKDGSVVTINFVNWDAKWNEVIDTLSAPYRFAPITHYSSGNGEAISYKLKDEVWVCPLIPEEFPEQWIKGSLCQIDEKQVQVEFAGPINNKRFQRWFHVSTEEIRPGDYFKPPPDPLPAGFEQEWFVGRIIEVKDTIEKWEPAEILKIDKPRIYITYMNWSRKWNEWIDVSKFNSSRIRLLGAALKPGEEEKKKKEEEEKFRKDMEKTHGFKIVEMDRDGNCLFRSVAHQIYNDPSRHAEIRKRCYDYMVENREFFGKYVSEDFDDYVKTQRQLNKWGDHVEIVALREIFNKNLQVYDRSYLKEPRPIGLLDKSLHVPTMRLSYHGSNHYNSVVNPKEPLPLGDGADAKISIRELRLQQDRKQPITQLDGKKMFPLSPELARGLARSRQLDPLRRALSITSANFEEVWKKFDTESGLVTAKKFSELLEQLIIFMSEKYQKAVKDKTLENSDSMRKNFEDLRSEEWRNKILSELLKSDESLAVKDFRDYYDQNIEPAIFSFLENSPS